MNELEYKQMLEREKVVVDRVNAIFGKKESLKTISNDTNKVMMPRELTAENGAKALLSGEFFINHMQPCMECVDMDDEDNEDCVYCGGANEVQIKVPVDWTTIKAIYAKAVEGLTNE